MRTKRFCLAGLFGLLLLWLAPAGCWAAAVPELADGEYTVEVQLTGGSGRATVNSPAVLLVRDGGATARLEWSSGNYDYMKVDGQKYLPVNQEGNSVFEIPVAQFDQPLTVIGDTMAMSVPHEVEYSLTFAAASIKPAKPAGGYFWLGWLVGFALVMGAAGCWLAFKRKRRAG